MISSSSSGTFIFHSLLPELKGMIVIVLKINLKATMFGLFQFKAYLELATIREVLLKVPIV